MTHLRKKSQKKKLSKIKMRDGNPVDYNVIAPYHDYTWIRNNMTQIYTLIEDHPAREKIIRMLQCLRIYYFAYMIRNGKKDSIEPIDLEKGKLRDGMHRLLAHALAEQEEIDYVEKPKLNTRGEE